MLLKLKLVPQLTCVCACARACVCACVGFFFAIWPSWLSACGLGVYWLHSRLDPKPKYYVYEPFKLPSVSSGRYTWRTATDGATRKHVAIDNRKPGSSQSAQEVSLKNTSA